jgi:hypothetical protein
MLSKQLKGDARSEPGAGQDYAAELPRAEIANGLLNFSRTSSTEFRDGPI